MIKALIRLRGCAGWSAPLLFAIKKCQGFSCICQGFLTSAWLRACILSITASPPLEDCVQMRVSAVLVEEMILKYKKNFPQDLLVEVE